MLAFWIILMYACSAAGSALRDLSEMHIIVQELKTTLSNKDFGTFFDYYITVVNKSGKQYDECSVKREETDDSKIKPVNPNGDLASTGDMEKQVGNIVVINLNGIYHDKRKYKPSFLARLWAAETDYESELCSKMYSSAKNEPYVHHGLVNCTLLKKVDVKRKFSTCVCEDEATYATDGIRFELQITMDESFIKKLEKSTITVKIILENLLETTGEITFKDLSWRDVS